MSNFPFDEQKTVNVILYILQQLGGQCDRHKLFKILYYADQKHLVEYGRPVIGDTYIAMDNGPVPSSTYDAIKAINDNKRYHFPLFSQNLRGNQYFIESTQQPDLDELSKSDITSIIESINENKNLTFKELKTKSHTYAYHKADRNSAISMLDIAHEGGANEDMKKYIEEYAEEFNCFL